MTQWQYFKLCELFDKHLTPKELEEMGFTPVDGVLDEELQYDMTLASIEERRRGDKK